MSRSCTFALALCSLAALCVLPGSRAQVLSSFDSSVSSDSRGNWDALGGLYALLAQHDALGGHALARKSVRSPSRRLRFGRRSDPDMPPQPPMDELDELLSLRDVRTPVRLRFGRRSDEHAVPHIFPQETEELTQLDEILTRDVRTPVRLRFGRRSDEQAVPHIFPKEEQDRSARAPSMRLRFGRRSDNMLLMPFEVRSVQGGVMVTPVCYQCDYDKVVKARGTNQGGKGSSTLPKEVKATNAEDDRQQE